MTKFETVTEWASHVAPLLDSDAWAGVRSGDINNESFYRVNGKHPLRADFPEMFAALLAYRDEVTAGLSGYDRACLTGKFLCGLRPVFAKLETSGLATRSRWCGSWDYDRTDFGREVTRVLRTA